MAKTEYTPGPWKVDRDDEEMQISVISRFGPIVEGLEPCYGSDEANANLISAAPDLLEALKDAREELRLLRMKDTATVYDPTLRGRIDLAIAKAEGADHAE